MYPKSSRLRRPRVLTVSPGLRHEQGPVFDDNAGRIAVVAHWSSRPDLSRSVQALLRELLSADYTCALVSTAETDGPLRFDEPDLEGRVSVFRRPNAGYDFGSWAVFLDAYPRVASARRVILANDSLVGPFADLTAILDGFGACTTDMWGLTSSTQDCAHLQSYMIGYTDGALARQPLWDFWRDVRVQPDKKRTIRANEIGLGRLAKSADLSMSAHFPWWTVAQELQNPTTVGWRRLILRGFPFVKRELVLTDTPGVPDRADIPAVIRDVWGQDVYEWV